MEHVGVAKTKHAKPGITCGLQPRGISGVLPVAEPMVLPVVFHNHFAGGASHIESTDPPLGAVANLDLEFQAGDAVAEQ